MRMIKKPRPEMAEELDDFAERIERAVGVLEKEEHTDEDKVQIAIDIEDTVEDLAAGLYEATEKENTVLAIMGEWLNKIFTEVHLSVSPETESVVDHLGLSSPETAQIPEPIRMDENILFEMDTMATYLYEFAASTRHGRRWKIPRWISDTLKSE